MKQVANWRGGRVVALAACMTLAGCKGSQPTNNLLPTTPVLVVAAGNAQSAAAGHAVAIAPSVTVTSNSQPASGVTVTFAVASGGGSVTGATATTDATGKAQVGSWTLGTTAGANTLSASATNAASVIFTATGTAGAAATLTKTAGDAQTASAGLTLPMNPAVTVADQYGNLVAGQSVTFAVASGGGSITGAIPATGTNGVATLGSWTLGATAGTNTLTATAGSAPAVTFTATGTAIVTLPSLAGSWHGTWVDTRYGVSGTITSIVLTQTSSTFGGTGTIDLSSLGLGAQNGTATGTISGNVVTFTFTASGFGGSGSGTLNGTAGSGTGGVTANGYGNFTFTGTASATQITGTFQFTSPTGGYGTITVTKP